MHPPLTSHMFLMVPLPIPYRPLLKRRNKKVVTSDVRVIKTKNKINQMVMTRYVCGGSWGGWVRMLAGRRGIGSVRGSGSVFVLLILSLSLAVRLPQLREDTQQRGRSETVDEDTMWRLLQVKGFVFTTWDEWTYWHQQQSAMEWWALALLSASCRNASREKFIR